MNNNNTTRGRHESAGPGKKEQAQKRRFLARLAQNMDSRSRASMLTPEQEKKRKKQKTLRVTFIAVLCVLLLLIACLAAFLLWSRPPAVEETGLLVQSTPGPEESRVPGATPAASSEPTPTPIPAVRSEDTYTFLLVGRDAVGMNTDTILVARMDCKNRNIDLVSIPRDTLVNVPWEVKKVNSIYGTLNIEGFVKHIENLVGFEIDNYIVVNTYIFSQIIDCVGGIWYNVPFGMYYYDPDQNFSISLNPGYQLLNGWQCEQLVRYRSGYANGDLGRIQTQQDFMREAARQILSFGNIANLSSIVALITEYTDTNLTAGNISYLSQEFLKMGVESIRFQTIPSEEVYIRGGSYMSIRLEEWLTMINSSLNPWNVDVTEANLDVLWFDGAQFGSTTGNIPSIDSYYDYTLTH